ncbi:MAG TPA: protein-disulfide reductase DsbD domain-containing protein [Bryobacteraceae bacterium]|nr:protein-disulfide reductase DsbD domain-containing protein [Bryobacteraceae bacterium]
MFLLDERGVITEKRFQQSYRERETGAGLLLDGFHASATVHASEVRAGSEGVTVRAWLDSDSYRYFQRQYLTVELDIAPGLHAYGLPIPDGFVPLAINVEPSEAFETGTAVLPEPAPFRIEGLDEQFYVHEGKVRVTIPVTFTKRDAGDLTLSVHVAYQVCSATDCLMPVSLTLEVPVTAAPHVASASDAG